MMAGELIALWVALGVPFLIAIWIVTFVLGIYIADERGRGGGGFLFWLLLFGPIAILALVAVPPNHEKLRKSIEIGMIASGDWKHCLLCQELVRKGALRCRYCGCIFEPHRAASIVEQYHLADQRSIERKA